MAWAWMSENENVLINWILASAGFLDFADQGDDFIQMIDGDLQAFQNMGLFFGLPQFKGRPLADDLLPKIQKMNQNGFQVHDLGSILDNGQKNDPESGFHGRKFIELI